MTEFIFCLFDDSHAHRSEIMPHWFWLACPWWLVILSIFFLSNTTVLTVILIYFFGESFRSFPYFLPGLFIGYCFWVDRDVLDTNPLSGAWLVNILSNSVGCPFTLIISFADKIPLVYIHFHCLCFLDLFFSHCLCQCLQMFPLISSSTFIVSGLTFRLWSILSWFIDRVRSSRG